MPYRSVLFAALIACFATAAAAQMAAPPMRIRGTIAAVDAKTLSIAMREGPTVKLALSDKLSVSAVKAVDVSAIKEGTFIGTAAEMGADGTLWALEVVVFPEKLRGTGEGHYGWDLRPDTSMTNATVSAMVESASGRDLVLSYKGGTTTVRLRPGLPIVTIVPAARADLKPGLPVFAVASKASDGALTLLRINVGKYGVAPPM